MKNREFKREYLLIADSLFYTIISISVLKIRPSFDGYLSGRSIILQTIMGFIIVFSLRFFMGIYKTTLKIDRISLFARFMLVDFLSVACFYLAQHLLFYSDRLEFLTVFLIVIISLLFGLCIRWGQYYFEKKSIDLTDLIPFSPPDISELEIQEVEKALRSGWITTGPRTKQLEKELAEFVGSSRCACLNSNTACAEMTLRLLGIGNEDEVITCAYTYTASASVVLHLGAKLILVDCSEVDGTIEMDYDALELAITERTKAIIPIDLAGIPCDYDRLFEIVNRKKSLFNPNTDIQKAIGRIAIVADGAHALGAKYKGKMVGSIADFTNFSFHAVKNFTTGEGGALAWRHIEGIDDEKIYEQIQLYSLHGQSKDALAKTQKGSWEYDIVGPWYKCNMTDIAAAIGLAQLERYPQLLKRRKKIIAKYDNELKKIGIVPLEHFTKNYVSSGHLYIVRVPGITTEQRNDIINKMAERNISCNVHYKPLPMMTAYKKLGFDIKNYPNAYAKFSNEITLPLYSTLTDAQVDYIVNQLIVVLNEYGYIKRGN